MDSTCSLGRGYLSNLCIACRKIQIPVATSAPTSGHKTSPHHQTFEDFAEGARQHCYICVSIWNRLDNPSGESVKWIKESWKPMRLWIQNDISGRSLHKLNLTYTGSASCNARPENVQFRLTPYKKEPYGSVCLDPDSEIGDLTSCASTIQTALVWLQSCLSNHAQCGRYSAKTDKWHPTRLIDLGPRGSSHWTLHSTAENGVLPCPVSYIALSYRWGPHPKLLLLSSTMQEFRRGKPIQELPKTFRDLAFIAREFSIRYIWIDALCIIQDSTLDWDAEALTMRHVYANAACTVAASASADESGGLFRSRDPKSVLPGIVNLSTVSAESKTLCIFERDYWSRNISTGPLHKRGWAFQERHLSPRVLYFGSAQVLWECFEEVNCEGFPRGIPFHWSDKNLSTLWDLPDGKGISPRSGTEARGTMTMSIYSRWRDLVKNYSQCSLTKVEDKLPAFAGIAKLFHEATGDDYLAGLWRTRILEGLDWRVEEPMSKSSPDYRAPSWSWASVDGPLKPELPGAVSKHLLQFLEAKVQPQGVDPFGRILGGYLAVYGSLIRITVRSPEHNGHHKVTVHSERPLGVKFLFRQARLRFYLDYLGVDIYENQTLYLLPLNSSMTEFQSQKHWVIVFLTLKLLANSAQPGYSRIGHCALADQRHFKQFGLQAREDGLMILSPKSKLTRVTIF